MIKGIDYTGITIAFRCHDGEGNYVMHKRGSACRDEHGKWDFGGGGLKFGESIEDALIREIKEEYGTSPISYSYLGHEEIHREHEGCATHWIAFRYKVHVHRAEVINNEPHKHDEIMWSTLDDLPSPLHSVVENNYELYKKELQ